MAALERRSAVRLQSLFLDSSRARGRWSWRIGLVQAGLLSGLVFGAAGLAQLEMNRVGHWPGGLDDVVRRSLLGPVPAAVALSFADLRTRLGVLAAGTLVVFTLVSGFLYAHSESSTAALVYLPQLYLFVPWAVGYAIWSRRYAGRGAAVPGSA